MAGPMAAGVTRRLSAANSRSGLRSLRPWPVPHRIASPLTGEATATAHRAGIKRVILPERSVADLDEVPQEVRDDLEFVPVSKMDEVLLEALETPEKLDIKPKGTKGKKSSKDQVVDSVP